MDPIVTTKTGIALLSSTTLAAVIQKIEKGLPGFWWSISQEPGRVTLSGAPTPECPSAADVLYALSDAGGNTTIISPIIHFSPDKEDVVLEWTDHFIVYFAPFRDKFSREFDVKTAARNAEVAKAKDGDAPIPPVVELATSYRSQSDADIAAFVTNYSELLHHISTYEDAGYVLNELLVGSCQLSVDCSLRGKRSDGSEFDFSVDYQGDATLAESVHDAEAELVADISVFNKAKEAAAKGAESSKPGAA